MELVLIRHALPRRLAAADGPADPGPAAEGLAPTELLADRVVETEAIIADHPAELVLAVCHGGVINAYLAHVLGRADATVFFAPNYTSLHRVAASRAGHCAVMTMNETSHLRGSGLPIGLFDRA